MQIKSDFDEASRLYPFWQNYPPEDRGRKPIKDQFPWIEVGEHAIGSRISSLLQERFHTRRVGLPSGADQRVVLFNEEILKITRGITSAAWLFVDIKSIGPRDDQEHTVMSHNQVSGDGIWDTIDDGVKNSPILAKGQRRTHKFYPSLSPIFVFSDGKVVPLVTIALKPVYQMLPKTALSTKDRNSGQPLARFDLACIPNGLLLSNAPQYLLTYPSLFFPGKDDKDKQPEKMRARVSFKILKQIADWRVQTLTY